VPYYVLRSALVKRPSIFALSLMVIACLGCSAQNTKIDDRTSQGKLIAAKVNLSKKLLSDSSILGVGIGSNGGSEPSNELIYVYVSTDASNATLNRIPKKYKGIPVSIVKTQPFKAQ